MAHCEVNFKDFLITLMYRTLCGSIGCYADNTTYTCSAALSVQLTDKFRVMSVKSLEKALKKESTKLKI